MIEREREFICTSRLPWCDDRRAEEQPWIIDSQLMLISISRKKERTNDWRDINDQKSFEIDLHERNQIDEEINRPRSWSMTIRIEKATFLPLYPEDIGNRFCHRKHSEKQRRKLTQWFVELSNVRSFVLSLDVFLQILVYLNMLWPLSE